MPIDRDEVDTNHKTRTTFAVGIDPGLSTGLAILRGDGFLMHVQQGPPNLVLDDFTVRFPFLTIPSSTVLIGCERYVADGVHVRSAQPVPLQVIGVISQLARIHGWKFRLQAPADVKAFVNNTMLRETRLWVSPSDVEQRDANDVNDAVRHALTILAHHRASLFERILTNFGV